MSKRKGYFDLTEAHINLASEVRFDWMEDDGYLGAPEIDPKRPYGNSDILIDVAEAAGMERIQVQDGEWVFTAEQMEKAKRIHEEMDTALEIILGHQTFRPGMFYREAIYFNWEKVS